VLVPGVGCPGRYCGSSLGLAAAAGIDEVISLLHERGVDVYLVSGGFDEVCALQIAAAWLGSHSSSADSSCR
jgi:hypothetical protein